MEFDEHVVLCLPRVRKESRSSAKSKTTTLDGPVPPLLGIASITFNDHISLHIALEEQSMGKQLQAAALDNTVNACGKRPVFIF